MSTNEQARVTHADAIKALDDMDDYARMAVGVDAHGPRGVLERYIAQQSLNTPAGVVSDAMVDAAYARFYRPQPVDRADPAWHDMRAALEASLSAPEPAVDVVACDNCGSVTECPCAMVGIGSGTTRDTPEPAAQGEATDLEPFREAIVFACCNDNMDKWRRVLASFDSFAYSYKRSTAPPAQPAALGAAVAIVRHFDYRGIARNGLSQEAQMLDGAPVLPDGAKLYTGLPAQPADRVPEGMVLVPEEMKLEQIKAMQDAWTKREKISLPLRTTTAMALYFAALAATPAPSESEGGKGVDDKWCDCKRLRVLHLKGEFQGCHYFCKCDACGKPVIGGSYGFPDVLCEACNTTQQAAR